MIFCFIILSFVVVVVVVICLNIDGVAAGQNDGEAITVSAAANSELYRRALFLLFTYDH